MLALLALCASFAGPQGDSAAVTVTNPAPAPRTELIRVSVPWPRGAHAELPAVRIGADVAPCAVLERWADGSVALAQAHTRIRLGPAETRELPVEPVAAAAGEDGPWRWPAELPIETEVVDPWGQRFVARLESDPRRPVEAWASTGRVRVRRLRGVHTRRSGDAIEACMSVRGWLVEFAGERRAELTVVLENDPLPDEPVIGPVRFSEFALTTHGSSVRIRPRLREANLLAPPTPASDGGWRQVLLGPSDQLYLGDRTGKAFRFDLFLDGPAATADERSAARLAVEQPILALPALDWVRATGAFGANGGPAPVPEPMPGRGDALVQQWRSSSALSGGPFGDFGDVRDVGAEAAARNGPCALHDALRWRSAALLRLAEAAALQQTLRPTPATRPREPAATAPWRSGMSPRAIEAPHGWTALDYEHFSVDLLHDCYWLTGDPLARCELARAGTGLLPLLDALPFRTSRGEGWCLQGGVLIARATQNRALLDALLERVRETLIPGLGPAWAVSQPPHADALGVTEPFDAPWQMAALVEGLSALWRATGADDVRGAIVRVARTMAVEGWVDDVGPMSFFSTRDPSLHALPVGHAPTVGTAWYSLDAYVLAGEAARAEADRRLFRDRAEFLLHALDDPRRGGALASPWFQLWYDRHPPPH